MRTYKTGGDDCRSLVCGDITMRALILLALLGAALAVPRNPQRIVGGENTSIERYPYMSNMQYGWWGIIWYQACGGSLITTTSVLSAAHCYEGDRPSDWRVILGTTFASSGGTTHMVSALVLHQQYSSWTLDNDVAIVRLSSPAVLSATVGTARIAGTNYNLADNTAVFSIGWGTLSPGGSSPEILQHVQVYTINQNVCAERYAYLKTQPGFAGWPDITPGMLCAGVLDVGGRDACQGDSGGPLAHQGDIVVGITSWGYSCAHATYPGVNARVSQYSNWITRYRPSADGVIDASIREENWHRLSRGAALSEGRKPRLIATIYVRIETLRKLKSSLRSFTNTILSGFGHNGVKKLIKRFQLFRRRDRSSLAQSPGPPFSIGCYCMQCSFKPRSGVSGSARVRVCVVPHSVGRAATVTQHAFVPVIYSGLLHRLHAESAHGFCA
ncbi:Trypsin CFT-1 [Eumeta japonica]|uniref:Trypsin CFT-1 n=1 Tax=Eumeta variegata TaxID=151549 RepID=A0A4C1SG55_EUMVA|nr:Trypsin CFT-1 [Eumeta japonica]